MPYSSVVTRGTGPTYSATPGAHPLIPEDVQTEIIKGATNKSAALSMLKKRTMGTQQQRLPVLSTKPTAYWVTGDTGLKQTTTLSWENLFLNAEEIAVNVPVPINVLEDTSYKLWDEIKPEVEEAIAFALDSAVFFGINMPSSWPASIVAHATSAGNTVTVGTQTPNDIASEINAVMASVESDGFTVNGFYMRNNVQSTLRGLRATDNQFIFLAANPGLVNTAFKGNVYGLPAVASPTGTFEAYDTAPTANAAKLIAGGWDAGLLGVRQDVKGELFREGVITDAGGLVQFNLMQQDMINMRFVARYAFVIANPVNRLQPTAANRSPFGVLRDAA